MKLGWDDLFLRLDENLRTIVSWQPEDPDPSAQRCEQSRHRTLGHLRACQEQWLIVLRAFLECESPSVKIVHPWRVFEVQKYAHLPWEEHLHKFVLDREEWMRLRDESLRDRSGLRNGIQDSTLGLTRRLACHETSHLSVFTHE